MAASLGAACRHAREASGLRQSDIATEAGAILGRPVSHSTISNFEAGRWWSDYTDEIIQAYAILCPVTVRELWQQAIDRL